MASMTQSLPSSSEPTAAAAGVYAGIDTHLDTHTVAVISAAGAELGVRQFDTTAAGYAVLSAWLLGFGTVLGVGIEGTGSYGSGLCSYLQALDLALLEVNRPDRATRRAKGKSDPIDALAAADAVRSGRARAIPKDRTGAVESIRLQLIARRSADADASTALNRLHAVIGTAPADLRDQLRDLSRPVLLATLSRLRPDSTRLHEPAHAAKHVLRALARRVRDSRAEIDRIDQILAGLVTRANPELLQVFGVGPYTAALLLAAAGENPDRITDQAKFAMLTGTAPVPVSSGKTDRHRLNRGGDRQANRAIHAIVLTRKAHDPRTRAYMAARLNDKQSNNTDLTRRLKRYVAREIHKVLLRPSHPATAHQTAA
jgi:transposase